MTAASGAGAPALAEEAGSGPSREEREQPMAFKVTQIRSTIGAKPKTRGTMRALGLRGIGQSNTLPDRPEIRGMLRRVPHLVTIEEVGDTP